MPDLIDTLAGIAPGSPLDAARDRRPEARKHAQASYVALFEPAEPGTFTLAERFAIAAFVAGLHNEAATVGFYTAKLTEADPALATTILAEVEDANTAGPYGAYPAGPLSKEDQAGLVYSASAPGLLGPRLAAALEHTHMLVFHPRDSAPDYLQSLLDAGWTTTEIVTLSQIVAFLAFQIRVVLGLKTLSAMT
jgi:CMD domain protein